MATSLIYSMPEKMGAGKAFAELMGNFIPSYLIVSLTSIVFSISIDATLLIFLGFLGALLLIMIDLPAIKDRWIFKTDAKLSNSLNIDIQKDIELKKFYLNLPKDSKYSNEIYRYEGYSNCFFHLSLGLIIIGLIHLLSSLNYLDIPIHFDLKISIVIILFAILSFIGSFRYNNKLFRFIQKELSNFEELRKKPTEKFTYGDGRPNDWAYKRLIEIEEMHLKLLEKNNKLISESSVKEIVKEKKNKIEKLSKERLEYQLELYAEIIDMLDEAENDLEEISYPQQYSNLDKKTSPVIKKIEKLKKSINNINKKVKSNNFNSDDIPSMYEEAEKWDSFLNSFNDYIDIENFLPKIQQKIDYIKTTVKGKKNVKLKEFENKINEIKNKYQEQVDKDYTLPFYSIWEEINNLQKIDEKISKKFKKYILIYRK
jgi:hypothetical protein